jgi:integrase
MEMVMTQPAKKTTEQYEKVFIRLINGCSTANEVLEKARQTTKNNTWFCYKAAVLFWSNYREHVADEALDLSRVPAEIQALSQSFLSDLDKAFQAAPPIPKETREPRHSKRKDMRGAPSNWRELLWDEPGLKKYRLHYALSAVTGCRPGEFGENFLVKLSSTDILFVMQGLKVRACSGQPVRGFRYQLSDANAFVSEIVSKVEALPKNDQGLVKIEPVDTKAFSAAIKRASRRLGLGGETGLSAYNLRHAFASDLKAAQKTRAEIAKALGHASEKTQSCYGQAGMSKGGGVVPDRIHATRAVKAHPKAVASKRPPLKKSRLSGVR